MNAHTDPVRQVKADRLHGRDLVHCRCRRFGRHAARDIVLPGKCQFLLGKEGSCILIINIAHRTCRAGVDSVPLFPLVLFPGKNIAVIDTALDSFQKQASVRAHAVLIRVGDIRHIIEAVIHVDNVPLVGAGSCAALHGPGRRIDLDLAALELCLSAEILEGL